MAIFAPNANSYRRFRANSYAPVAPVWGVNNRTCAFRVPAGAANTRHIEHRVAGADAHPALALAVLLAAVHHGMTNKIDPGPAVIGDGYAHAEADRRDASRPTGSRRWIASRNRRCCRTILANASCALRDGEAHEQERFFGVISNVDYDWYLQRSLNDSAAIDAFEAAQRPRDRCERGLCRLDRDR